MPSEDVVLQEEELVLPTYCVGPAEPNPIFYSGRSYQGAKGPVYPYPMLDRLSDVREDRAYRAVRLENRYIELIVLPEIGGRILAARDKTNGYDFFYRQHVIKPALIGCLGAWISGGAEWNLPHHHRPTTFMPVDYRLSHSSDGSGTLWVGETELRHRMRWIVGITLHPDRSDIRVDTRLLNRTHFAHSFLCFTNAAVSVNEQYQVVFPPGTQFGTQHGKHEFVHWPIAREVYGEVDHTAGTDVSWWKNHPHFVSIFAWNYEDDFFGGYDHGRKAGVCHVADHHIDPGKKFFEFGNCPAGRTWDRILTDEDGPYLELMAGAYSDNQPDYSWIQPGETKVVTEYWYPIRELGGIRNANRDAVVNLEFDEPHRARVAFNTTTGFKNATVIVKVGERELLREWIRISPDAPFTKGVSLPEGTEPCRVRAALLDSDGVEIISYRPEARAELPTPAPVVPPPEPREMATTEELYLAGLRLEQFHSPAREPYPYYEEALRRDPHDVRANTALGILYCKRGMFEQAEEKLQTALGHLTRNYTSPKDGEPHYYLGVAARAQGRRAAARDAFARGAWSFAWRSAGHLALAEMDAQEGKLREALTHIEESIDHNAVQPRALNVKTVILRKSGRVKESIRLAEQALAIDPLDFFAHNERALSLRAIGSTREAESELAEMKALMREVSQSYLELACDYGRCGQWEDAADVLRRFLDCAPCAPHANPLVHYTLAFYLEQACERNEAARHYRLGREAPPDSCFPFQLESAEVLLAAMEHDPSDPRAPYYLGNLLYDLQPSRAMRMWERARELDDTFATAHRNLALGYARQENDLAKAVDTMRTAVECDPRDPRLLLELDELLEAQGADPHERLALMEARQEIVEEREDAVLREARLHILLGRYDRALELLADHRFHVWEGGESNAHDAYVDAHLLRGRVHLAAGRHQEALADFQAASEYPERFDNGRPYDGGRAPEVDYFIGLAQEACGLNGDTAFRQAAEHPRLGTSLAFYQGMACGKLGFEEQARGFFDNVLETGRGVLGGGSGVGFFAKFGAGQTESARRAQGHYLTGLGLCGRGEIAAAIGEFRTAAELNTNHLGARVELAALMEEQQREV